MLFLDLETYSETPINHGTFAYAAAAEIMLLAYAIDDGPVSVWDLTTEDPMPRALRDALSDPAMPLTAHNAQFDANVLWLATNSDAVMRAAGEAITRWRCTMAQALSHSLPAKLEALAQVLRLPADQLKHDGRRLVLQFCKPHHSGVRWTKVTHPEDWQAFVAYAGGDIVAMREAAKRMPVWNWQPQDVDTWHRDQTINRRGFAVDRELATKAIALCKKLSRTNNASVNALTDGRVEAATQRERMLHYLLAEHGVDLPDMKAATLERRVDDPSLPWAVRELLAMRLTGAKNATSKYSALLRAVSADDRLRGSLQFRGASRTGRDAGRLFQPQNLPRPKASAEEVEEWIEALKQDATEVLGYDDGQFASDALRGCIVAAPGRKLVQADFSNVEGRLVAWYAKEDWKVQAFLDFDAGKGHDLYNLTYARAFGVDVSEVGKDDRQKGKVIDLAGGYQGWVGACKAFASVYRVEVDDETAARWMGAWRDAHPKTRALWRMLEESVKTAARHPDRLLVVNERIKIIRRGNWLKIQIPSGRILSYPHIALADGDKIEYAGQDQYTRKWSKVNTFGGKLLENIVQATAADLLWHAVFRAEATGFPVVLRVHDELVTEPVDSPDFSVEKLCAAMTDAPAWAKGLPLAAEGFEAHRYAKG